MSFLSFYVFWWLFQSPLSTLHFWGSFKYHFAWFNLTSGALVLRGKIPKKSRSNPDYINKVTLYESPIEFFYNSTFPAKSWQGTASIDIQWVATIASQFGRTLPWFSRKLRIIVSQYRHVNIKCVKVTACSIWLKASDYFFQLRSLIMAWSNGATVVSFTQRCLD